MHLVHGIDRSCKVMDDPGSFVLQLKNQQMSRSYIMFFLKLKLFQMDFSKLIHTRLILFLTLMMIGPFCFSQSSKFPQSKYAKTANRVSNIITSWHAQEAQFLKEIENVKISISEKHKNKLEKITSPAKKLKKYRKYYSKDSSKIMKGRIRLAKQKSDSLFDAYKQLEKSRIPDSVGMSDQYGRFLPEHVLDSGHLSIRGQAWVKDQGKRYLSGLEEYEKMGLLSDKYPELADWLKVNGNDPGMLSQLPDSVLTCSQATAKTLPGMVEKRISQMDEFKVLEKQSGQLTRSVNDLQEQYKSMGEKYIDQPQQYTDPAHLKSEGKKSGIDYTRDFIAENIDQIEHLKNKLADLRKKYASISNSTDMSTAKRRNSFQGRPVDEKIILGGNFDIQMSHPVLIDLAPLVGFRLNKKLSIGLGGTYRVDLTFDSKSLNTQYDTKVYGFNSFLSYDIVNRFFVYGQYDYLSKKEQDQDVAEEVQTWEPGFMAGIGRSFRVHTKITGTVMLLYNVVESNIKSPFGNRFQVRFGFQTNELTFKKVNRPY